MPDRRTALLDAALELVGTQGMRGLTHRAVDAAADLPPGSTSNYFRTREALILGIVERFVARERQMATGPRDEVDATPDGVAAAFGRFVAPGPRPRPRRDPGPLRDPGRDRPEPGPREGMATGADQVDTWALDLVTRAGSRDPARDLGVLANYVRGSSCTSSRCRRPDLDAAGRIRAVIDTLGWRAPAS